MKFRPVLSALVISSAAIAMLGCQAPQLPSQVSSQLISIRAEVAASRDSIVQVGNSLKNLRESSAGDLKVQFQNFSRCVDALEKRAGIAGAVVTTRQAISEEYFSNWDREISQLQSADLRERGENRKAEAMEAYETVKAKIGALRSNFQGYLRNVRDTQRFLASDLTPAGKKQATPSINEALKLQEVVLKNLDDVVESIDKLRVK